MVGMLEKVRQVQNYIKGPHPDSSDNTKLKFKVIFKLHVYIFSNKKDNQKNVQPLSAKNPVLFLPFPIFRDAILFLPLTLCWVGRLSTQRQIHVIYCQMNIDGAPNLL